MLIKSQPVIEIQLHVKSNPKEKGQRRYHNIIIKSMVERHGSRATSLKGVYPFQSMIVYMYTQ